MKRAPKAKKGGMPTGHRPEHGTERAVYPMMKAHRMTVAVRKPRAK